jgi:dTDP-4-amino-4,6-dideoxygalactose transaminase
VKINPDDLAILGGQPAFPEALHVGRPNIGDRSRLLQRIEDLLDRKWLTNNGRYVQEFESRITELTGAKHCIAMCNATVALEIVIRALDLTGEVIIPSFTFISTAHALQWQQITPVFCDIGPKTHAIDPSRVEELITSRTSGIIGVHVWGRGCEVEALEGIAARHNLKLFFDAAHAFDCSRNGVMIGNSGEAEVFSFHATKFINTFEGGAVVTNNDALAKKIRLMNNFGFSGYDNVVYIGTNGKMSEVSAAMGLTSLESMDEIIAINRRNYELYRKALDGIPGIGLIDYDHREKCNYQYIVLEISESTAGIGRDDLLRILWAENVIARRYFYPGCHRMEPYRSYYPHAGLMLPATNALVKRVLLLPTGTDIEAESIDEIANIMRVSVNNAELLAGRLPSDSNVEAQSVQAKLEEIYQSC